MDTDLPEAPPEPSAIAEACVRRHQYATVGRLAGPLAHDVNNLLVLVIASLEVLVGGLDADPKLQRVADQALQTLERTAELLQALATLARPVAPSGAADVSEVLSLLGPMLRRVLRSGIELDIVTDDESLRVAADRGALIAAILNLCFNARAALGSRGRLSIRAGRDLGAPEPRVSIEVEDTGCGIASEHLSRIFEAGFSARTEGGLGWGLSSVQAFARDAGGDLGVASIPGQGTRVSLQLPAIEVPLQ
jgi:signal transduction histidine kinase